MTNIEMKLKSREQLSMEILTLQQKLMLKDKEIKELYERVKGLEVASSKLDYEATIYANRIDKAIEYIKWNLDVNEEVIDYFNFDANFNKLLEILQGSDKE